MKSAWQALDIWPRTPETRPRAPETRPRAPETYSQRTCSCALCRKYANASVRWKFLRKRITMDPTVTTQDRKSQRKTITLQKVRKRQCQMEVSAGKDHHGSHCDIPGLQNAPIVSTPLSYIRKSTRIPREQRGGALSWNPVGPSTRPGYPQCVRSCQGAQNLSRFARFPFLPKAGRYDQHPGKFIVINRNGGPNGQLSRNIENPTNP